MTSSAPWASISPTWSAPTPAAVKAAGGTYGTLYATQGARGAWVLCHDRGEQMHALTTFGAPEPVVEHDGRRWHVVALYRDYEIADGEYPEWGARWQYQHKDFDGPDAPDHRYGTAGSIAEAMLEIDEMEGVG